MGDRCCSDVCYWSVYDVAVCSLLYLGQMFSVLTSRATGSLSGQYLNIAFTAIHYTLYLFCTLTVPFMSLFFLSPDNRMIKVNGTREPLEFKSHQWFGASVRAHRGEVVVSGNKVRYYLNRLTYPTQIFPLHSPLF